MPIVNGIGSFNTGIDCKIVVVSSLFPSIVIPNVTRFNVQQKTQAVAVDRLDGTQLNAELPKGWTWAIEAERSGNSLDTLIADIEDQWYSGGTISFVTIYQYITEPNVSRSAFQMDNCSLKYDDAGDWRGDRTVTQRLSGTLFRRRFLGTTAL